MTLRHRCSSANLLDICSTPFLENTSGWLLLSFLKTFFDHRCFSIAGFTLVKIYPFFIFSFAHPKLIHSVFLWCCFSADDADIHSVASVTDLRCFSRLRHFILYHPLLQFYEFKWFFFMWGVFYLTLSRSSTLQDCLLRLLTYLQKQPPEVFCKKRYPQKFCKIHLKIR